jgi:hypothetical protein
MGWLPQRLSATGALKRIGLIAKKSSIRDDTGLVKTSANLSKVVANAGVLTATGFITQAAFAAVTVGIGSAAIGVTAGTIIPVIGALVFVSGFVSEKIAARENLRVTMILVHKEAKRMEHIIHIINSDVKNRNHISFDVYKAMVNELNRFIMSMMTKEQLKDMGIDDEKGISSLNRYFSTVINPGSFMNIILERLSRTTSAFAIIIAEYTIRKHGMWGPVDETRQSIQEGGDYASALAVLRGIAAQGNSEAENIKDSAEAAANIGAATEEVLEATPPQNLPVNKVGGSFTRKKSLRGTLNKV